MPDQYTLLLEFRRNEAAVRGLAKLPHDFYRATAAYLAEVRRSYETELRENPSGRKGEIARQTYQRATQAARDVVEARAQKILAAAFHASIGGARDLTNALGEERAVFDELSEILLAHRRASAPYLEGANGTPATPAPAAPAPASTAAEKPAPATSPSRPTRSSAPLAYVRIVQGGRAIEVGSETLDLRTDDIVSVSADAARLLVEAKIAEAVATGTERPVT